MNTYVITIDRGERDETVTACVPADLPAGYTDRRNW